MLQRSEKGKQFRQYFIKVKESWNSPAMIIKQALDIANAKIEDLQANGRVRIRKTPKITGKGQCYFINKFLTANRLERSIKMRKTKFFTNWDEVPIVVDIPYISLLLGVHPETIRRQLASGKLKGFKVGTDWRINKDDLGEYIGINNKKELH